MSDLSGTAIMGGEINAGFDPWAAPLNTRSPALGVRENWAGTAPNKVGFGSQHVRGTNVFKVEGSVALLSNDIDPEVLKSLSEPRKQDD